MVRIKIDRLLKFKGIIDKTPTTPMKVPAMRLSVSTFLARTNPGHVVMLA